MPDDTPEEGGHEHVPEHVTDAFAVPGLYVPAGQAEHADAPDAACVPALQPCLSLEPPTQKYPDEQVRPAADDEFEGQYLPGAAVQAEHAEAPDAALYVPAVQDEHLEDPDAAYVPALQAEHAEAPDREVLPASHAVHGLAPVDGLNFPAAQLSHASMWSHSTDTFAHK